MASIIHDYIFFGGGGGGGGGEDDDDGGGGGGSAVSRFCSNKKPKLEDRELWQMTGQLLRWQASSLADRELCE